MTPEVIAAAVIANRSRPLPAPHPAANFVGHERNQYELPTSRFRCGACRQEFTVTPAIEPTEAAWPHCLAHECDSYDIDRDVLALAVTDGATLHRAD